MISGKYLQATINGNVLIAGVMEWRARETVDKLDGQTGASQGYSANQAGSQTLAVDLTLIQDLSTGVYAVVSAGSTITNLQLWRSFFDQQQGRSPAFTIPTFTVFESDNGSAIKDKFTVKASGEAVGPYSKAEPGN